MKLWSLKQKYKNWILIEILNCQAWNKLNLISDQEIKEITNNIGYNFSTINELEKNIKHDVVAFTRAISIFFKQPSNKWIHYGLTSTDLVDTGNAITFMAVNKIISKDLKKLINIAWKLAQEHKLTPMIGRTHGIHAEVTSFGFKMACFVAELKRHNNRFEQARKDVETIKISGSIGNYNQTDPRVEKFIAAKLKLNLAAASTQVLPRDHHLYYFQILNGIGLSLNRFAQELRLMSQTELNEISEGFTSNQKGSSSMPHKRNPISLEKICGLSRLLNGYCHTIEQNVALWHERDISHSSNERIVFQDATNTIIYCLRQLTNIIDNLYINTEQMAKNIEITNGKIYSQKILHILLARTSHSREEIYDFIQELTNLAHKNNKSVLLLFTASRYAKYINNDELKDLFDNSSYLKFINQIFLRIHNE